MRNRNCNFKRFDEFFLGKLNEMLGKNFKNMEDFYKDEDEEDNADDIALTFEDFNRVAQQEFAGQYKPFAPMLVRDNGCVWTIDLFERAVPEIGAYMCMSSIWDECLPYCKETKHLLWTKEDYYTVGNVEVDEIDNELDNELDNEFTFLDDDDDEVNSEVNSKVNAKVNNTENGEEACEKNDDKNCDRKNTYKRYHGKEFNKESDHIKCWDKHKDKVFSSALESDCEKEGYAFTPVDLTRGEAIQVLDGCKWKDAIFISYGKGVINAILDTSNKVDTFEYYRAQ